MKRIYVVGTADTKGHELKFIAELVRGLGAEPLLVDVGTRTPVVPVEVTSAEVSGGVAHGDDRGTAVKTMADAFARWIVGREDVGGVVGIGGGGGTSIVTAGMRALPIGIPKLMVSTLASGDVAPYVGISDIVMMPAITDVAGLNRISRTVFSNAAHAIVAMAGAPPVAQGDKPALGLTMFGVTTPAVTAIADALRADYEPLVFHATGTGGQTMEALVDSGLIAGVLDITTTEVCDLLFGGVLPALPTRFDCIARTKVPYVGSLGACDMVNFWAPETVPPQHKDRLFYHHNANVTLMRTTAEECRAIGAFIGNKLNACEGPVRFLIPEKGVSALDVEGGAFWDPDADEALFDTIKTTVKTTAARSVIVVPAHINDRAFADAAVAAFREIMD